MNKTSYSSRSGKSVHHEGFRVMVKKRDDHRQPAEEARKTSFGYIARSQEITHPEKDNITQMKQYVRRRMKTEQPFN